MKISDIEPIGGDFKRSSQQSVNGQGIELAVLQNTPDHRRLLERAYIPSGVSFRR